MVAIDRRLDLLTSELTGRERAILWLRAWCQGESADERLRRFCPPQDMPETDRIIRAVEHASGEAHGQLIILLEWTALAETEIHSLKVLTAYQERVAALEKVARRAVLPLPAPWDCSRQVPVGWGRLVRNEDRAVAKDWEEFRVHRLLDVEESLMFRWRDVLGFDVVFGEVAAALGERLVHHQTQERLDWLREHVLRLAAELSEWDEDFSLPSDPGTHDALLRESIDWDALGPTPRR